MDNTYTLCRNLAQLKKCRKIYTILFYYFIASTIIIILYGFLSLVSISLDVGFSIMQYSDALSPNFLQIFFYSLILGPVCAFFGYKITVKQRDIYALLCIAFLSGNFILLITKKDLRFFNQVPIAYWLFIVYSISGIIAAVIGLKTTITYHWLEEQPGFPLFNERQMNYDFDKNQHKIKDPYQINIEKRVKTASNSMTELDFTNKCTPEITHPDINNTMNSI